MCVRPMIGLLAMAGQLVETKQRDPNKIIAVGSGCANEPAVWVAVETSWLVVGAIRD